MAAKEWSDNETFLFRNVLWTLDWEEITSNGQKHFQETIIVCATKAMRKQQINKTIIYGKFYSLL